MRFSTEESVSLEKKINVSLVQTSKERLFEVYDLSKCIEWVKSNQFQKVCLQFPDSLLNDSTEIAAVLEKELKQKVYVLGDTAYKSCCIDYIAAAHINADAVIHFGPICFSKVSGNIPHLNVYERAEFDIDNFHKSFNSLPSSESIILIDTPFIHYKDEINSLINETPVKQIDEDLKDCSNKPRIIFIGTNLRKLINIQLNYNPEELYSLNASSELTKFNLDQKIVKRRYFLIEKIKDSNTIGIVIATLAVKNYMNVIERVKKLIQLNNKKYYMISVGKPTVAKLANFPEVDTFVVIACSMNEIYDDRDYYKPLVTPFDLEMALNPSAGNLSFSFDYNTFINDPTNHDLDNLAPNVDSDVSLLSGGIRCNQTDDEKLEEIQDRQLVEKPPGIVAKSSHGAGYLANRSWRGLEQHLGETEVKLAEEGRNGIAQGYTNETMK